MSALTRSLLQRDTVRDELRTSTLAPHLLSDDALEQSRRVAIAPLKNNQSLWIFGYGSLVWNPQLDFRRAERAHIFGYRRALCIWSRINRGTPEQPGLVFGLLPGGSCAGIAYEIPAVRIEEETTLLWRREMLMGSYVPVWTQAYAKGAPLCNVLTFRVNPACSGYAGALCDDEVIAVLGTAHGRFGTCAEYVRNTLDSLEAHGIHDARLSKLCKSLPATK